MTSGIYKIENTTSSGFYIGRSVNVEDRLRHHRNELRRGVHRNKRLQNSWNKYGEDVFKFELIWEEPPEMLEETEGIVLQSLWWRDELYNHHALSFGGFAQGNKLGCFTRSEETRRKIGEWQRGRVKTDEHRAKLSESKRGKTASEDAKRKMSKSRTGKARPQSWHEAMAEYRRNHPNPMAGKVSPMRGKKFPTINCEHCGKQSSKGNYLRWHGGNCKKRSNLHLEFA